MKRIVITSSAVAIMSPSLSKPTVFSERDWNESSIKEFQNLGNKIHPGTIYSASKALAEKGGFFIHLILKSSRSYMCIFSCLGFL